MKHREFFPRILNLGDEWDIEDILINEHFKEIDIFIKYNKSTVICRNKNTECRIYDFRKTRRIRHLDILDYQTYINVRLPRSINNNSEINTIKLDWLDDRVSYTYLFECKVISILQSTKNQTKSAKELNVSYDIIHRIMERAVLRGLARRNLDDVKAISLDEKSFRGKRSYMTILSDPITKNVLDVIEGRKIIDTEELLLTTFTPSQLNNIHIASIDMWKAYVTSIEEVIPNAEIVHDKFHIAKYLNEAVNNVRKEEVKKHEILKKTKFLFLKNKESLTIAQTLKFEEIKEINLKTSIAWQIKENFKGLYTQDNMVLCFNFFEKWYENVLESGIKKMIKVADMMVRNLKGILNSAMTHITNSVAENLNGEIQVLKTVGRGFANVQRYRDAILFFKGKLNLLPH